MFWGFRSRSRFFINKLSNHVEEEKKAEIADSTNSGLEESKQVKSDPKDEETKLADTSPKRPINQNNW